MNNLLRNIEPVKPVMTILFIIDTSGSMAGEKISIINHTICKVIPELLDAASSDIINIKINVLTFSNSCQWLFHEPISVENVRWINIDASGRKNLGGAYIELNNKMSVNEFLIQRQLAPVIILMMGGSPEDNYRKGLELLKNNQWFKHALKVAVAIGDDTDENVLLEFTSTKETILKPWMPLHKFIISGYKITDVVVDHDYEMDICDTNGNQTINQGTLKNYSFSITIVHDDWEDDINAEVLSISPLRNYFLCKNIRTKELYIVRYSKGTGILYKNIPLFHDERNINKITWDEFEKYFSIYYETIDEDQCIIEDGHRFLTQNKYCYEILTKDSDFFEINANVPYNIQIEVVKKDVQEIVFSDDNISNDEW
jgi:uncharacterized protein YegL